MAEKFITVKGVRVNNLKNINVSIPRDKLTVLTGLSGSGKSSLAFDTLYAEGHRRFVESLSSYARMFLGQLDKPDIDSIEGLSPAIAIDQKTTSRNPRSTVGTVTEIYDYLRLLWARTGIAHCPVCGKEIVPQSVDRIIDSILAMPEGTRFALLAPVVVGKKGLHEKVFQDASKSGFVRVRLDGTVYNIGEQPEPEKNKKHTIEIVVDRLVVKDGIRSRLTDSVETALRISSGTIIVNQVDDGEDIRYSTSFACEEHGISYEEPSPRDFSFNSPFGACPACSGLGETRRLDPERIIPDPTLSIRRGAVAVNGFKSSDEGSWLYPLYEAVGQAHGFTVDMPIAEMSEESYKIFLYGSGDETYDITREFSGRIYKQTVKYTGIIAMINQRVEMGNNEYYDEFFESAPCPVCNGKRLKPTSLSITVGGLSIDDFCHLSISEAADFIYGLRLDDRSAVIAADIMKELKARLNFLKNVGLDYLNLARSAGSLSGGEAQRIRLATQIGSSLMGVMYILDEPSIGLHQRDNHKLIETLKNLRDAGNTVIVVEHDEETIAEADYIVDIGPGAGIHGGEIVACGTPDEISRCTTSVTGDYLSGRRKIEIPAQRRPGNGKSLKICGARENNLKNIDVTVPLGCFVCVTGVSGSGKSSLVNSILYSSLARTLNRAYTHPGKHDRIEGVEALDKIICIDQSPIGRTPRSNPATYTGLFTDLRELFSKTPDARTRGYKPGRFSFNIGGGRCETCEGDGVKRIEMHFLPDVYVRCDACKGQRYNRETLEVKYKGKNIYEVLEMSVEEGLDFFGSVPKLYRRLKTLYDVGLGYIKIGQSSTTLSGGEAQRVKLATELSRRGTGRTIYILDEPTTGLHSYDVECLIGVLNRLVDAGNSIVVIEHNLDMIKIADHIIDLGPEGGDKGGIIVAEGTPEQVADTPGSFTGYYLKNILNR